ncbi:hypothetical protein JB92DRAFT_3124993 [Gautieria morchelliformis]|nr:hypothetical protein JB92DRAFT_3124993 [Gautieria morchelliformis]
MHIPLAIWQACPSTSNGNEQAHRNVNRDGTGLTLLAAIMRGMHYDKRAMAAVDLMHGSGIHPTDQPPNYFRHAGCAVLRQVHVHKCKVSKVDDDLAEMYKRYDMNLEPGHKAFGNYLNPYLSSKTRDSWRCKLQEYQAQHEHLHAQAKDLATHSSGTITERTITQLTVFDYPSICVLPMPAQHSPKLRHTNKAAAGQSSSSTLPLQPCPQPSTLGDGDMPVVCHSEPLNPRTAPWVEAGGAESGPKEGCGRYEAWEGRLTA